MQERMLNSKCESKGCQTGDAQRTALKLYSFFSMFTVHVNNHFNSILVIIELILKIFQFYNRLIGISEKAFDLSMYPEFPGDVGGDNSLGHLAVCIWLKLGYVKSLSTFNLHYLMNQFTVSCQHLP